MELKETIETKIKVLKEKAKDLAKQRTKLMEALDGNSIEIMKTGGAIEELSKLVENKEEGKDG